jgi:hypothetical protein
MQATTSSAPSTPDLPLHTPAASIPSAADVAVRAGLAERGPDGSLFTTSPPASSGVAVQRSADDGDFSIQRVPGVGSAAASAASGVGSAAASAAAGPGTAAGRAAQGVGTAAGAAGAAAGGDAGAGAGKDAAAEKKQLAAEAKKLYPFIRSALEADIRRQIEGKSRASRFRP